MQPARFISFETDEVTWLSLDLSPDGETLVLEVLGDLYTLPVAGGHATRITDGMAYDSQPAFSPDGARIAFVSDRDGAEALWMANADGSEPKKLSNNGDHLEFASPSWAPDGSHVVVSRTSWPLATFELWGYHVDGGKGVQITKAKKSSNTPRNQRKNSLGAVYSNDAAYLYFARKNGGFFYNLFFPQWQIMRRELRTGNEDFLTRAQGSAIRPRLSPNGRLLVYGTRYEAQTGLRVRDLTTGDDRWLVYPVQRDEQESRFTRDLLPGYAFTPDGTSLIFAQRGRIRRVDLETSAVTEIPFTVTVEQGLGPRLHFPYRIGLGPVKARVIQSAHLSPDGKQVVFSALTRIYIKDLTTGNVKAISPENVPAFHPNWSPDGRFIVFVSWSNAGGHIWRMRANGRGARALTQHAAYYSDPVFAPDGKRIVALRAGAYDRLYREGDFTTPIGSDVVWLPANGGETTLVIPTRGFTAPHFGPEGDRIYVYLARSTFSRRAGNSGLFSMRFDGTDRVRHLTVNGEGVYHAEENVAANDIRISPDGRYALVLHANQLYIVALLNVNLRDVTTSLDKPSLPVARITDVGADHASWSADGNTIAWTVGDQLYRRPLDSVDFRSLQAPAPEGNGHDGDVEPAPLPEAHAAVSVTPLDVYRPRYTPSGLFALVGATVLPMETDDDVLIHGVVVINNDRIDAVGSVDTVEIPPDAHIIDVSGQFILPGFIDVHAHYRPLRRILDTHNASFLANLAYGVTTGLDVQPGTVDVLAYQDLIDAGLMIGPRALSTGPAIFSNNNFKSYAHTHAVLSRYKDGYRVRNIKAYIAGSRKQRQWIAQAANDLHLMPTTEGALDMKLNMTHVIDGFSGQEHNFPLLDLYRDTVELVARSGIGYTPTLLVSTGGPNAENYFYATESPALDAKLRRFTPHSLLAARTTRRSWFAPSEHVFEQLAQQAAKIIHAGGHVGVGAHGQLQGLGYHWEMWALASGGLSNREVLRAATRHGAEMIGIAQDVGTVSKGKLADLVILRKDPREDIRHTREIAYVVKNGELFDGDTLDKIWPDQTPLPTQWWWNEAPPEPIQQDSH
ncbi:MAG: amidohydrolase family protein [Gammaproteobacteria bacterium]|nr:amidohydrolase family protein [Gammaproteobacteria bacterium]